MLDLLTFVKAIYVLSLFCITVLCIVDIFQEYERNRFKKLTIFQIILYGSMLWAWWLFLGGSRWLMAN